MDGIASALGDAARWRMLELLAERPRSVGELAELTGLRQPQATKHLQTLARAGLVTSVPLGQRRVHAIEAGPLAEFARRLGELVERIEATAGERSVLERYRAAVEAETTAAARDDAWAEGRLATFERLLAAPPAAVWRQWTDPALLAAWWAPPSLTVGECVIEPRPGGRVVLEYRDGDARYRSAGRVRAAEAPERLTFDLSVLDAAGAIAFTGHYDLALTALDPADAAAPAELGTRLRLDLRITGVTAPAAPFVAGIETGWGQVLDNLAASLQKES